MTRVLQWIYFFWCLIWFLIGFLLCLPFFLIIIPNKKWHPLYYWFSKGWAVLFYTMIFIPVKRVYHFKAQKDQAYIYCPNHFSYMDITLLTLTMPAYFVFVGLHDLKKIPVFGYIYRSFHITVNRASLRDRYKSFLRAKEAIQEGKNLLIFPEGGIWTEDFPEVSEFKEGPFRIAIELQIPIVPVTIPYNWKMIPVFDISRLKWHRQEIIYHPPISTEGLQMKDLPTLQAQTRAVIEKELKQYFP